ncbi:hypothetical protein KR093_002363 [Drosophila rubida]|uniref:Uncharacterized protein n=1 Tax=Drosophila rubida TaxID=30044 RepID=A0AAD4K3V2_9MUSC|nr:hypothetical protein KR093_002363 [Drosophila rubida]
MAPKNEKKDKKPNIEPEDDKPQPPNIFLYIQLASIRGLPASKHALEIHMDQGGSVIVKCVEQYNTEGIILEEEFKTRPTYTLIFQQDNLDRINHAADNPLLVKLYLRKLQFPSLSTEDVETILEEEDSANIVDELIKPPLPEDDMVGAAHVMETAHVMEKDEGGYFPDDEDLLLLCVGYLDLIKLFGHHRCMVREELFLYPVPEVPTELRCTVHSEWHLYTLVPIAKEITFTNMAFVSFESIYNIKQDYTLDVSTLNVQLSFRSTQPIARNEYQVIPWCSFSNFKEECIANQNNYLLFESFRNNVNVDYCLGLKSTMEVGVHRLFEQLMRSDNLEVSFPDINPRNDNALICNTFHRFILNRNMSDTLENVFAFRRYVIFVEVFQTTGPSESKTKVPKASKQKVFEGILDPAIMLFPGVQTIRFAVELKYLGARKKPVKPKHAHTMHSIREPRFSQMDTVGPTFAIIKLCLLAPLGETYHELKVFRESFVIQNRLLHCNLPPPDPIKPTLSEVQRENYLRFDSFVRGTIRYIVDKKVETVEEKRNHFCCVLQNLTNILMKLVGSDFNNRTHTTSNQEFRNVCSVAFNELETRIHNLLEKIEDEGFEDLIMDRHKKSEHLFDVLNGIKLMKAVGDNRMANYFYEKEKEHGGPLFEFHNLITKIEQNEYASAKVFFKTPKILSPRHDYLAGWIRIFINYIDTRNDPDPSIAANANECLLKSITLYAEKHVRKLDGWILLYCYYKRFEYAPGYNYARWRLEGQMQNSMPKMHEGPGPLSLWSISLNTTPELKTKRGNMFFICFKLFVRLGLYEFGQVIFDEFKSECDEVDRYLINTQLKMLLKQLDTDFEPEEHGSGGDDNFEEEEMSPRSAFVAQVNGNIEFARGNWEKAASYYERIVDRSTTQEGGRDHYLLSKLRLAHISFQMGNFDQTVNALSQPFQGQLLSIFCNYLMGKAYYRLDDLNKALECFIACTSAGAHMPNTWGFLALINLHLGNNVNAINCWKYARVDPSKTITDETIYEELDLIDIESVDLFVDAPSTSSCSSTFDFSDEDV